MDTQEGEVRLHLVSQGLRRRKFLIMAITVAAIVVGFLLSSLLSVTYTATSTLLLQPMPGNPLSPASVTSNAGGLTIAMATEANLVDTPAVIASADKIGSLTISTGKSAVSANVPSNTQIVQISYAAGSPAKAQAGAQALGQAFLDSRVSRAQAYQQKSLASLQLQEQQAQTSLNNASAAAQTSGPNSFAAQQVQIYASLLATIKDNMSQIQSGSLNPGSIVNPAAEPHSPSGLPSWLVPLAFGLIGLIAAGAFAIWLELRTDVVRTEIEPDIGGAPLLADLPASASRSTVVVNDATDDVATEAYRRLRAGVLATTRPPSVIAVTCLTPKGSSAAVAVNLALLLGQVGYSVTIVDAAPGDRGAERLLDIAEGPGLGDVLKNPSTAYHRTQEVEGVRVLPVGTNPSATEIFAGRQFDAVVDVLRRRSDYVLIVAEHAATAAADAAASTSDGVLVVVNDQVTTHTQIAAAMKRLDRLERPVIGAVSIQHARRRDVRSSQAKPKTRPKPIVAERPSTAVPVDDGAEGAEGAAKQGALTPPRSE
ncbi:MAG: hypothetical protein ACRDPG_05865 [Nocardioidaceae bacterium]